MSTINGFRARLIAVLGKTSRWFRLAVRLIWTMTFCFCVLIPIYIYAVIENPYDLFGALPSLREVENPENDLSSEVISADGVSLGRYFRYNRSAVAFEDLSPELVNTLLTSEDHRFYSHTGVDPQALLRVIKGVITFDRQGGGSTLTQQTAKNLFRTREDELLGRLGRMAHPLGIAISKTKENIIAFQLEKNFTKEEIIALYLNTVPFNNNAYGIRIAAETYFKKRPSQLDYKEAALLVGMLQGTSVFNPVSHPDRAWQKRNEVIIKLFRHGFISKKESDSVCALPLGLNFGVESHNEGLAPYFRTMLRDELERWCKEHNYDLVESGLKIYTTIDSRLQAFAEKAMADHMSLVQKNFDEDWGKRNPWVDEEGHEIENFLQRKITRTDIYRSLKKRFDNSDSVEFYLNRKQPMKIFTWNGTRDTVFSFYDSLRYYNRFLHAGLMSMEPETGAVRAWVGGINHRYFQYDHVKQAKRQPGSTFKPFLYGLAIENGFSPCNTFEDISPTYMINGSPYHVRNAGGNFGDSTKYTLRQALAKSLNSISVQLIHELKPENLVDFAARVGITSKLDPVYSLALGTSDVNLLELTGAYSTFVNKGVHIIPYYITRIEDKHGNVIANFTPSAKQALNEHTAYAMVHMLRGGVEEQGGSSRALSELVKRDNEVGGKTGTTDNGSDGWYMGITRNLVTGVWVGGDERSIHFPHWGESSGGRTALPIFDKFMQLVYSHPETGYRKENFEIPDGFDINLDCSKYQEPDTTLFIQ